MFLRRILSHKVSVEAMIEAALWFALPYVVIGLGWAFAHPDQMRQLESQIQLAAGADLVALGLTTLLWPMLLIANATCAG